MIAVLSTYNEERDGRLSWPSWLTHSEQFTHNWSPANHRSGAGLRKSVSQRPISRDVCKSRIHYRRDYRDFRLVPWFSAIAAILCHSHDYHHHRLLNSQFCINICSAFLSWTHIVAWLTLLPCRECIYRTMASCIARLHSSFLDQTDWQTRIWPVTLAHVTTSMQL